MFVLEPYSVLAFKFLNVADPAKWNPSEKLLLKNSVMKKHMTYVVEFVHKTVQVLDDEAAISQMSKQLGARHMERGARMEFLKVTTSV